MGWSEMDLGLVKRVRDVIWEYTRRQTRDHFRYTGLVCEMEYVVIYEHIVPQERVLRNSINQSMVSDTRIPPPTLYCMLLYRPPTANVCHRVHR
jgi:hypothetical protein